MKVVKELTQGILLNYFTLRGKAHLVVSVLTFFDLEAPEAPLSEQEMWKFVPLELGENAVLDAAMPKPRAEVLLKARCCAPGGVPRPAAQVSMRVGDLSKKIDVFGPRFWERRASGWAISDPLPFTQIDIDWGNAFGGPRYELNPLGRGIASATGDADAQLPELPAVEDPRHLIGSPVDRPQPAGFMPLDQSWPPRSKKAGTHDAKWFRDHWPYFPEDMDWTFFNTAPADQQQDAFFQGGEEVELIGLHPERQVVRTCLPRLRQRVFAHQLKELRDPAGGLWFREAHSRLDTVWLFPHALRGVLVHRAVLEVADEEAVDVRHLYLVTESADESPGSLEHHLAALNKRLDRSVQVDLSKLDAAMVQAAQAMKQVKDIPKAVAHSLEAAKGNVPDAGISPHNAAALCRNVLDQSKTRLQEAEKQLLEVKAKFGHMVKIDLAPLSRAGDDFERLKENLQRQMDAADTLTREAQATKSRMQDQVLKALDRPETREFHARLREQIAPAADSWPEKALSLVRQGRYDLTLDPERLAALRKLGLRPVTLKRAMVAVVPQPWVFVPQEWGLDPAPPAAMPAGYVLAAHEGSKITRLAVRPGAVDSSRDDAAVPGSAETVFSAGLAPGKCVVRVADPLEAWLIEQDAGDYVGALALAQPDTPVDAQTADLLEAAPRLLIVLYSRDPAARQSEFAPWAEVYPQAEPLPLPTESAVFDAHAKGVALEEWITAALAPESPLRAEDGPDAAGVSIPSVDARGLYQTCHEGMMEKMAPMLAEKEALEKELPRQMDAAVAKVRAQLRKDGLEKMGIDLPERFDPSPAGKMSEAFMAGFDPAPKYDQMRGSLDKAGLLTAERRALLDSHQAGMTRLLEESKARWAAGRAKLPAAGEKFAFPEWARKLVEPLHIDLEDREPMTREKVAARHANQVNLKGKDLSGLDLSGLDLGGADLRGARMQKTNLVGARLDGADLSGVIADEADFSGAFFRNGKAVRALLGKACFAGAALGGTDFSRAVLKEADLTRADLTAATLERTLLERARLTGARLAGVKAAQGYFMGADLSGADFSGADAPKAVFFKASAAGADFSGSNLTQAILWDTRANRAIFNGSNLQNARFGGSASAREGDFGNARLEHASLIDADLSGGDFKGSRLEGAYLRNCKLTAADLSGVKAKGAFFHRTDLEGADMSRLDLRLGSLRKSRLVKADLSRANLYGSEMYRATVGQTRFDGANLKMTLLHKRVELLDDPK